MTNILLDELCQAVFKSKTNKDMVETRLIYSDALEENGKIWEAEFWRWSTKPLKIPFESLDHYVYWFSPSYQGSLSRKYTYMIEEKQAIIDYKYFKIMRQISIKYSTFHVIQHGTVNSAWRDLSFVWKIVHE